MDNKAVYLSTVDNPYSPAKDFEKWYDWDQLAGYDTCGLLARMTSTTSRITEKENVAEVEQVIDEIIANDPTGLYIKIEENS